MIIHTDWNTDCASPSQITKRLERHKKTLKVLRLDFLNTRIVNGSCLSERTAILDLFLH